MPRYPVSTLLCTAVFRRLPALAWSLHHLVVVRQAAGTSRLSPRGSSCPPGAKSSVNRGRPGACHRSGLGTAAGGTAGRSHADPRSRPWAGEAAWPGEGASGSRGWGSGPPPPPRRSGMEMEGGGADLLRAVSGSRPCGRRAPTPLLLPVRGGCRPGADPRRQAWAAMSQPRARPPVPAARGTQRSLRTGTLWGWWPQGSALRGKTLLFAAL